MACLLHDISNGAFLRTDHGYWGAQMIAPYVSEEIAWAIKYHQALRYFADEAAGFKYPDAYNKFFGPDYKPPEYIHKDYLRSAQAPLVHDLALHHDLRHLLASTTRWKSIRTSSPTSSAATSGNPKRAWASTARRWRTCGAR